MNLVALGVGLGAPGMHLAWVLLPASGALKICHNSNFYGARFLAEAHILNIHPAPIKAVVEFNPQFRMPTQDFPHHMIHVKYWPILVLRLSLGERHRQP